MMEDKADGRLFFPALIFDQFKAPQLIGKFDKPVHGVAMYDFNKDGRMDIYACSAAGDRLYMQTSPLVFTDCTKELGLAGAASTSVNVADIDGDGRADLLLDGVIWKQGADGHFSKTKLLPAPTKHKILCSVFADINGDGYPDVLVSYRDGGIALYLNPGVKGGPFIDATKAAGLDKPECGAGGTGWLMVGDWNNDGHPAIFYSSGGGFLLVQNKTGFFCPADAQMGFDFKTGEGEAGLTGAGCFGAVWKNDRQDLVFPLDTGLTILVNDNGEVFNGASYGNELQLLTSEQLPMIAEDLNADGNVDLFVGSRGGNPNTYYVNRGYGTFMIPARYKPTVFPGTAHQSGAWGIAAGDVNGDGANDLLLGGVDGDLTLIVNDTLRLREPAEHPTAQQQKLEQTCILSVQVTGKLGVFGATVTIADDKGRIVGRRDIGSNSATGCQGPDTVNLAVREPGLHQVTVRFSDGVIRKWPLQVGKVKHVQIIASHEANASTKP
jgi:hypothetical protein